MRRSPPPGLRDHAPRCAALDPTAVAADAHRVLRDLEDAAAPDPLPLGAGAQVAEGAVLAAPVPQGEAAAWARRALSDRAA